MMDHFSPISAGLLVKYIPATKQEKYQLFTCCFYINYKITSVFSGYENMIMLSKCFRNSDRNKCTFHPCKSCVVRQNVNMRQLKSETVSEWYLDWCQNFWNCPTFQNNIKSATKRGTTISPAALKCSACKQTHHHSI